LLVVNLNFLVAVSSVPVANPVDPRRGQGESP
jgi:hypothetical protein